MPDPGGRGPSAMARIGALALLAAAAAAVGVAVLVPVPDEVPPTLVTRPRGAGPASGEAALEGSMPGAVERSAPAGWTAVDERAPGPAAPAPRPAGARTELDFLRELVALAREDPEAFGRRADRVLSGSGPACEQVALLRAAYDASDRALDLFARALARLPDRSGPRGESVPSTAVRWLARRAPREERARRLLEGLAACESPRLSTEWRCRALRELVLAAPDRELPALSRRIELESDPCIRTCGTDALNERKRREAQPPAAEEQT